VRRLLILLGALVVGGAVGAAEPRATEATAPVRLRDDRGAAVVLRAPLALHRGANHYRLWGTRPYTLHQRARRADLYRDALLELATRSTMTRQTGVWDDLRRQVEWLRAVAGNGLAPPPPPSVAPGELERSVQDLLRRARDLPGAQHLGAVVKALGALSPSVELPDTVMTSLQLRALATDEAERRLELLARGLTAAAGQDPALADGLRAARAEFRALREGLWPAIAAGLRRSRGQLLWSAARQALLTPLGGWAIFGFLAWKGAESVVNAEYRGQYAVCLATLAAGLAEAARADSTLLPHALYAEYALTHQLTEALRQDGVLALKPAGGKSAEGWQVELAQRLAELRPAIHEAAVQ
jgi:hypothetical protein